MNTLDKGILIISTWRASAIGLNYNVAKLDTMLSPLISALNSYYTLDISKTIEGLVMAQIHSEIRTGITYKDGSSNNPPAGSTPGGYSDIRTLFTYDNGLYSTTVNEFTASIQTVIIPPAEEGGAEDEIYKSAIVDTLVLSLNDGITELPTKLSDLMGYCGELGLGNVIKKLFEPKEVATVPSMDGIKTTIYTDRHYAELIDAWSLDVYIP